MKETLSRKILKILVLQVSDHIRTNFPEWLKFTMYINMF